MAKVGDKVTPTTLDPSPGITGTGSGAVRGIINLPQATIPLDKCEFADVNKISKAARKTNVRGVIRYGSSSDDSSYTCDATLCFDVTSTNANYKRILPPPIIEIQKNSVYLVHGHIVGKAHGSDDFRTFEYRYILTRGSGASISIQEENITTLVCSENAMSWNMDLGIVNGGVMIRVKGGSSVNVLWSGSASVISSIIE